jgi:predicted short-subunit dehydrogenase-like oxidoreductase (DUF2520 family)
MASEAGRSRHGRGRGVSPPIVIVGEGRVGLSLAADLIDSSDSPITVVGQSLDRPSFLRDLFGVTYLVTRVPEASFAASLDKQIGAEGDPIVIFCVPDDDLSAVAKEWSESTGLIPRAVLHTSGVHSAAALEPWRKRDVAVAAWHPLVAVAAPGREAFRGVWFGVDGDEAAAKVGGELADRLGGRTHVVRPEGRSHYHAAGVFASNYLVSCLRIAADELRRASEDAALEALLPLAQSALRNLGALGLRDGATGPVARGDVRTVAAHLEVLDPRRAALYRGLGMELLELMGDRLEPAVRDRLAAELDPTGSDQANRRPSDE